MKPSVLLPNTVLYVFRVRVSIPGKPAYKYMLLAEHSFSVWLAEFSRVGHLGAFISIQNINKAG